MTKVSYVITHNGKEIPSAVYSSYNDVMDAVRELGKGFGYNIHYTPFDPEDTPARREALRAQAIKRMVAREAKRKTFEEELKHAPAYVNTSSVGAH